MQRPLGLDPGLRGDFGDLMIGEVGQADEEVAQVDLGIKAATTAAFDYGINDGAALACFGVADEEPVLLAEGGGANGIFDPIVINLHPAIIHITGC